MLLLERLCLSHIFEVIKMTKTRQTKLTEYGMTFEGLTKLTEFGMTFEADIKRNTKDQVGEEE